MTAFHSVASTGRRRRTGLTLLELVVAMSIGGLAVSAGYAALAGLVDRRDALRQASIEVTAAAASRQTIIDWLGAARLDPLRVGASFRGTNGVRGEWSDDELTFLTGATTPLNVSRTLVTLRIARDSGTAVGLVADLRDWDGVRQKTIVLSANATGMDVSFKSALIANGLWSQSWITATVLPLGVEIRLEPSTADALPSLLRFPILVPLQGGN